MIVSDIKTRIKRQFGDESGVQLTDADILRYINDGQRQIVLQNEGLLEKTATQNAAAGEDEYSLPADLLLLHSVSYKSPDQTTYLHLKGYNKQDFDNYVDGYDGNGYGTGVPTCFTEFAGKLILFLPPEAASTDGIKIFYTRKPTDRTVDGDTIDLPELYHEALVKYCLQQAYEMDEDWTAAGNKASEMQADVNLLRDREQWFNREAYPMISISPEDYF